VARSAVARTRASGYPAQYGFRSAHIARLSLYAETLRAMEAHVDAMACGSVGEAIWLVEHPSTITAGTSAVPQDLLDPTRFPVVATGRGGRHTYHGPGQRVVYPMLDLGVRGRDLRRYVGALETWVIETLGGFGVAAFTCDLGTGIWVETGNGPAKIGAIGVRVRRWISFHGLAINVSTDLTHFDAIVPCGISGNRVARLADLVPDVTFQALDTALLNRLPTLLHSLPGLHHAPIKTLEAGCD
jgi:lipoyl(octanoyl) transferase